MTWFRSPPGRAVTGLLVLYGLMIALVVGLRFTDYRLIQPARIAVIVAVSLPAAYFLFRYWRGLDEAAQEAQKWAWFWGGSTGMGLGLMATAIKPLGLANLFAGADAYHLMSYGAMTVMIGQLAGFTVAWAYWWISRR